MRKRKRRGKRGRGGRGGVPSCLGTTDLRDNEYWIHWKRLRKKHGYDRPMIGMAY